MIRTLLNTAMLTTGVIFDSAIAIMDRNAAAPLTPPVSLETSPAAAPPIGAISNGRGDCSVTTPSSPFRV